MTDTPNFYFFNKKKSSVTAFILDLSINGIFEAWKILVAEKEIILAQEYRLFLIRLPIYMGKMALTQKSAIIGRFSRMSNSDSKIQPGANINPTSVTRWGELTMNLHELLSKSKDTHHTVQICVKYLQISGLSSTFKDSKCWICNLLSCSCVAKLTWMYVKFHVKKLSIRYGTT